MGLGFLNNTKSTVNLLSSCRGSNDLWAEFESSAEGTSTNRLLKSLCTVLVQCSGFSYTSL